MFTKIRRFVNRRLKSGYKALSNFLLRTLTPATLLHLVLALVLPDFDKDGINWVMWTTFFIHIIIVSKVLKKKDVDMSSLQTVIS